MNLRKAHHEWLAAIALLPDHESSVLLELGPRRTLTLARALSRKIACWPDEARSHLLHPIDWRPAKPETDESLYPEDWLLKAKGELEAQRIPKPDRPRVLRRYRALTSGDWCGASLASLRRWRAMFDHGGLRGLIPGKSPGRPRKDPDAGRTDA